MATLKIKTLRTLTVKPLANKTRVLSVSKSALPTRMNPLSLNYLPRAH